VWRNLHIGNGEIKETGVTMKNVINLSGMEKWELRLNIPLESLFLGICTMCQNLVVKDRQ
jgi:hypothetical protein